MRISGWHIDGFGIFHDYEVRDLPAGLTLFYGPNEAGKSTLLGFVRTMLFGFRRADSPQHYPPLCGGRHGGRLFLAGPAGDHVVERWVTARTRPRVVLPDGTEGTENDLAALLGNADQTVFESVFAFSLGELQDFRSLDKQGITERIVAAPVVGGGVSIQGVLERLDEQAAALYSARKGARIPGCLKALSEAEAALAEARRASLGYPALVAAEAQARDALQNVEAEEQSVRSRLARAEKLMAAWPAFQDRAQADAELDELPACPQAHDLLPRAARLASTAALQRQRLGDLPQARAKAGSLMETVAASLAQLGPGWDADAVLALPDSLPARDEVRCQGQALQDAAMALQRAEDAMRSTEQQHAFALTERDRLAETLPEQPPPTPAELDELSEAAARLRVDLPGLANERRAAPLWLAGAAGVAALVLVGLGVWLLATGQPVAGVLSLGAAVLAALTTWGVSRSAWRAPSATRARVQADLRSLGLSEQAGLPDVERARAQLHRSREERREHEQTLAALGHQDARLRELGAEVDAAREHVAALRQTLRGSRQEWLTCCERNGLPVGLTVDGATDFLQEVRAARERLMAADEAQRQASTMEDEQEHWATEARELIEAAGDTAPDGGEPLVEALLAVDQRLRLRMRLLEASEAAERRIRTTLGADADELRTALERGDPAAWEQEREAQQITLDQLRPRLKTAIEQLHAARGHRQALEESADVARLDGRRQEILAELVALTGEWRTAVLAAALVRETLERYTAAHQPAVMAGASSLFAEVTAGRYRHVLRDAESDAVLVRGADGARRPVDHLSRGTAEELYLCIRLALADEFAALGRDLPLVMDDVLVNFDQQRARAMCRALRDTAARHQVLLFTCHPATRDMLADAFGDELNVVELPAPVAGADAARPPTID